MTSIYLCMFLLIVQQKIFISAVEFTVNPGCNLTACQDPGAFAMFYGRKDFDKSSVHILYSSMEELTIGAIETPTNQQPQIDYEKLFSKNYTGAISFPNSPPITALALTVRRLIEFNDVDDTGNMKDDDNTSISYTFNDTQTINVTFPSASTDQPTFLISIPEINGTLTISIVYPGELLRDSQFPKLQVTNKGFFINIALEATGFHWPRTRFALEFYIFTFARESPQIIESKYIDDQYTPGIFKVFQLKSTSSMYTASMLWKPVVYLSQDRSIEANTLMQFYSLKTNVELDPKFDRGIANALFNKTYVSAFNVSLGQSNDGFYTKNNYTFLQFTASLDESQLDSTTTFVSIALIVSLALPIIVGTIAVIFIVKRRCTSPQPTAYDSIAE